MNHFQKMLAGSGLGLAGFLLILLASYQSATAEQTALLPVLPDQALNYANQTLPPYYTNGPVAETDNTPANNPITDAGATLGRVLFYDQTLSANGTISCASCHIQEQGFSDNRQFSVGFDGGLTGRNSMGLANGRFSTAVAAASLLQNIIINGWICAQSQCAQQKWIITSGLSASRRAVVLQYARIIPKITNRRKIDIYEP